MTEPRVHCATAVIGPTASVEVMTSGGVWPKPGTYRATVEVYANSMVRVWIDDQPEGVTVAESTTT